MSVKTIVKSREAIRILLGATFAQCGGAKRQRLPAAVAEVAEVGSLRNFSAIQTQPELVANSNMFQRSHPILLALVGAKIVYHIEGFGRLTGSDIAESMRPWTDAKFRRISSGNPASILPTLCYSNHG
ncbi:hypothetical protein AUK22_06695 [bacterium CG2_30_54_10]|nr:MAG: hypothetical protein AUK22_06695 [bacterium CG2_30_54_10]